RYRAGIVREHPGQPPTTRCARALSARRPSPHCGSRVPHRPAPPCDSLLWQPLLKQHYLAPVKANATALLRRKLPGWLRLVIRDAAARNINQKFTKLNPAVENPVLLPQLGTRVNGGNLG